MLHYIWFHLDSFNYRTLQTVQRGAICGEAREAELLSGGGEQNQGFGQFSGSLFHHKVFVYVETVVSPLPPDYTLLGG